MANISVEERLGIRPEWVEESYRKTRNMAITAKAMKISTATVHRILKRLGVKVDRRRRGKPLIGSQFSCVYKWLQQNPGVKLPREAKKIMELTGCSKGAVYSFLRRRKLRAIEQLKELPDLRRFSGTIQLEDGTYLVLSCIQSYKLKMDPYTGHIQMEILDRDGNMRRAEATPWGIQKKIKEKVWKERT